MRALISCPNADLATSFSGLPDDGLGSFHPDDVGRDHCTSQFRKKTLAVHYQHAKDPREIDHGSQG